MLNKIICLSVCLEERTHTEICFLVIDKLLRRYFQDTVLKHAKNYVFIIACVINVTDRGLKAWDVAGNTYRHGGDAMQGTWFCRCFGV